MSKNQYVPIQPILLPEEQMEGLLLQQRWREHHNTPLPVRAKIPSWSLIAQICHTSDQVGFLPDYLSKKTP